MKHVSLSKNALMILEQRYLKRDDKGRIIETPEKLFNTCHSFVFQTSSFKGKLIDSPEGYLEWVDDHKIYKLDIFDKDKIFLPWIYESDKFFTGKFYSIGNKLKSHNVNFIK